MPRHPNHGTLPSVTELRRLYVQEDLSFVQLANRYGVRRNTVYNKLHRHAVKTGSPWPLKQTRPGWRQRAARKQSLNRWDGVSAQLLAMELRDCAARYGVTFGGIADRAGINPNHVHQITGGFLTRVSRRTCELLMDAVVSIETDAEGEEWVA